VAFLFIFDGCMRAFLLFTFIFFVKISLAGILKGTVKSAEGEPLAFANVFIKTTGTGTTTNADGFYQIEISPGSHEIIFKYLGYKTAIEKIEIGENEIELNIVLEKESYWISEVVVKAGEEDPAYQIIRNAIANKKINKTEADEYECEVYIKGLQKLDKYPKRLLGIKINIDEYVDPKTGIVYLSESISRLKYKSPGKINEEIISSKVSGNNRAFSFNRAADFNFTVYDNLIDLGISQRSFISPVSNSAFFYYKFRLEGVTQDNDQVIYKIRLLPIRQHDPVFRGYIYIAEERWRVQSLDLIVTKDAIIEFVDTLRIKQVILPVRENLWMPVSLHLSFNFKAFGFEGNGYFAASYMNYKFNNNFSKKTFRGDVVVVKKEANRQEEDYWEKVRPIPLTLEEKNDYVRKDSIFQIKETDVYKDSIDAVNNEFSLSKLFITGLSVQKRKHKSAYYFKPLIETVGFNTVQGWNTGLYLSYHKRYDDYKRIVVSPYLNYGFSDEKINAAISASYSYNRQNFAVAGLGGGKSLVQYNSHNPVGIFSNTVSTLLYERNHLKLYDKSYFNINHQYEIVNGLKTNLSVEYASRTAVNNTTTYVIKNYNDRNYTNNIPFYFDERTLNSDLESTLPFQNHKIFSGEIKFTFIPGARYYSRPSGKYLMENKNPTFHFNIKKALPTINTNADYLFIETGLTQSINFKNAGSTELFVNAGKFPEKKNLIFPDWVHFNGNRMFLTTRDLNQFRLLDYYHYSTTRPFIEFHAEHQFAGYFFNKIPGVRRLKLTEVAGFHTVAAEFQKPYYEITLGIEKLAMRLEYAFLPQKSAKLGSFRFVMPF
jgi:hypothetical protein